LAAQRYDTEFIPRVEDGLPSLSRWQDGTPKVDHVMRKNIEINNVGDPNIPYRSPPDAFFSKGVNCEFSSKITTFRMPLLNGIQNCSSWVEDGECSQSHQMV
jgi:hypothetical protein